MSLSSCAKKYWEISQSWRGRNEEPTEYKTIGDCIAGLNELAKANWHHRLASMVGSLIDAVIVGKRRHKRKPNNVVPLYKYARATSRPSVEEAEVEAQTIIQQRKHG